MRKERTLNAVFITVTKIFRKKAKIRTEDSKTIIMGRKPPTLSRCSCSFVLGQKRYSNDDRNNDDVGDGDGDDV